MTSVAFESRMSAEHTSRSTAVAGRFLSIRIANAFANTFLKRDSFVTRVFHLIDSCFSNETHESTNLQTHLQIHRLMYFVWSTWFYQKKFLHESIKWNWNDISSDEMRSWLMSMTHTWVYQTKFLYMSIKWNWNDVSSDEMRSWIRRLMYFIWNTLDYQTKIHKRTKWNFYKSLSNEIETN